MDSSSLKKYLIDLSGDLLEDDYSVKFRMGGHSMFPTFRAGQVGIVEKVDPSKLKRGDIVVFMQWDRFIAHRLVRTKVKDGVKFFYARGDKISHTDNPFTEQDLIGKIVSFQKRKKTKSTSSTLFRIKGLLIMALHPILLPFFRLFLMVNVVANSIITTLTTHRSNYKLIRKGSEGILLVNIFISVLQGILPFGVILCLKWLIDSLSASESAVDQTIHPFLYVFGITALVFLLNALVTVVRSYYFEKLSFSVSMHTYDTLHRKHSNLHMSYYENSDEQDKIHRAVQEASFRPIKILSDLLQVIRSTLSGIVIIALFIAIKWYLILILLPALLPGVLVRLIHSRRLYRIKKENSTKEREIYYYNRVLTALPFAKELKLFAFTPFFQNRFKAVHSLLFNQKDKLNYKIMWYDIAAQTLSVLAVFGVFGFISLLAISGKTTIGTVAMTFLVFQRGYTVLAEFSRSATQIVEDNIFLNDLTNFINLPPKSGVSNKTSFPKTLEKGITIEKVNFCYKPGLKNALENVSLSIPAKKIVAFVGKNGSGKTTMVKLLCGFYQPNSGRILFDAIDSTQLDPIDIRKNITAVFQDFALYNLTVAENIAIGNIHSKLDIERVKAAAKNAGIADIIEAMPNGYNNMLGTLFPNGKELSIGQWQKFAIARAFYRDSPILIMDEPSSALDAEAEMQVLQKLKILAQNKTVIVVSHRLSTIQWADLVYTFDEGKIIESGTN